MEWWKAGMEEEWIIGGMEKKNRALHISRFCTIPLLHHSNTPFPLPPPFTATLPTSRRELPLHPLSC